MDSAENKGRAYREGELDLILSLAPTLENVRRLAGSLGRSEEAIEIVYRIAYKYEQPFASSATSQRKKVTEAKERVGFINIFRKDDADMN